MILIKKFRIFILVVGLFGTWIHPSEAQTLKCASYNTVKTCDDDTKTPNCGVDGEFGKPNGCMDASNCPDSITAELSCQDGKIECCCKATATELCNDLLNNQALREKACKLKELKDRLICAPQLTCHDDTDMPMAKKCEPGYLCGAEKNGEKMGCIAPSQCSKKPKPEMECTNAPYCCCNTDNCNTRAKVCEATKAPGCSPAPPPTGDPTSPVGGSSSEQATAAAVPVSVGSLVCIMVSVGFSHHVSSVTV